jgi:hypothetical protein
MRRNRPFRRPPIIERREQPKPGWMCLRRQAPASEDRPAFMGEDAIEARHLPRGLHQRRQVARAGRVGLGSLLRRTAQRAEQPPDLGAELRALGLRQVIGARDGAGRGEEDARPAVSGPVVRASNAASRARAAAGSMPPGSSTR